MAHVTDSGVWHISQEPVTVDRVIEILNQNTQVAQQAVRNLVHDLTPDRDCDCPHALAGALITRPEAIPAEVRRKLGLLADKYLNRE